MATFKVPSVLPTRKKLPDSSVSPPRETGLSSDLESANVEKEGANEQVAASETEETQADGNSRESGGNAQIQPDRADDGEKSILNQRVVSGGAPPPTPSLPYTEPHWSGAPSSNYYLTVIKSGSVVDEIDISSKPFNVFGRLPVCDVPLDHPSISRYHAVLQYRPTDATPAVDSEGERDPLLSSGTNEAGFYVYDLNSTHRSFLNKNKLQPRVYYRVRVGQMVRFGGSSRLFVLEVGSVSSESEAQQQEMVEAEAEAEIRELQREKEAWLTRQRKREEERERLAREREEMGATWGMVMDEIERKEEEEEEVTVDPEREAYYKDDPKKALKKYFDREGIEFEYEVEEEGSGRDKTYVARVTLPIESGGGEMLVVEECVRGKKKEAVVQCALKACRILDSNDMLHPTSKGRQRLSKNWEENDYYDSDEDSFLDRTGDLERKRQQRMKRLGKLQEQADNYDSLERKLKEVKQQKQSLESRLSQSQQKHQTGDGDSLDQYMCVVSSQLDPATVTRLKKQVVELGKEEVRIIKLLKIAKPTEMPSVRASTADKNKPQDQLTMVTSPTATSDSGDPATDTASEPSSLTQSTGSGGDGSTTASPSSSSSSRRRRRKRSSSSSVSEEASRVGGDESVAKKVRVLGPVLPPRDMPEQKNDVGSSDADAEFASWLPPENQTGDGRTHLNDKYGY